MAPEHGTLAQALGAGGAHKVFTQHFQHGRAGDARQDGGLHHGQGHGRQDQRLQGGPPAAADLLGPAGKAAGGKPLQLHRKQQDQQDGEPEVGDGDADLRQAHGAHIAQLVVVRCGIDAGQQGQHGGQQHGHHRQGDGDGQALQHQLQHGRAVGVAVAHLALEQAGDPVGVALPGGLVQAQLLGHGLHGFRVGVRAQQHLGHVAGQDFQHTEHHHGRTQQGGDQGQQSFGKENAHKAIACGARRVCVRGQA